MDGILKRAATGSDAAEVYHVRRHLTPVTFRSGRLESVKTQETDGAAVRVVRDGRLGFASSTDLADPKGLADAAAATAVHGDLAGFSFPGVGSDRALSLWDEELADAPLDRMVSLGDSIVERLQHIAPSAQIDVSVTRALESVRIENTSGLAAEEQRSWLSVGAMLVRAKADDIFTVSRSASARSFGGLQIDSLIERLAQFLEWGETVVPGPTGAGRVVFLPTATLAILLPLAYGFSGVSIHFGTSPLKGRRGETIADPRFSLSDDPTAEAGERAGSFDDEGTPTRSTALIDRGQIDSFYYDLRTAALDGALPTANGYRGDPLSGPDFRAAPAAGVSHLIVGSGDATEDDLVRAIGDGLLVESVLGLGQGNLNAGDFANNVGVGFRIEGGRIVGRVKNAMIAGNVYQRLSDGLIGLGREAEWVYGRIRSPAIALSGVGLAGKG